MKNPIQARSTLPSLDPLRQRPREIQTACFALRIAHDIPNTHKSGCQRNNSPLPLYIMQYPTHNPLLKKNNHPSQIEATATINILSPSTKPPLAEHYTSTRTHGEVCME